MLYISGRYFWRDGKFHGINCWINISSETCQPQPWVSVIVRWLYRQGDRRSKVRLCWPSVCILTCTQCKSLCNSPRRTSPPMMCVLVVTGTWSQTCSSYWLRRWTTVVSVTSSRNSTKPSPAWWVVCTLYSYKHLLKSSNKLTSIIRTGNLSCEPEYPYIIVYRPGSPLQFFLHYFDQIWTSG